MNAAEIRRVARARKAAEERERTLSEELHRLVGEAMRSGMRPAEVRELTGWSPAQIRIVARAAGVGPARPGRPPKAG